MEDEHVARKMNKRWRPSVTVAAVIEHEGRFLLVEEHTPEGLKLNNPAGHLEPGETPQSAVVREALEETGREFVPEALIGVYLARFVRPRAAEPGRARRTGEPPPPQDITYLRFAYSGRVGEPQPGRALDTGIVRTLWLTRDEIAAAPERHRSPLLMRCIDDHLAGKRFALEAVVADASLHQPLRLIPLAQADALPGAEATMPGMSENSSETPPAPSAPPAPQPAEPLSDAAAGARLEVDALPQERATATTADAAEPIGEVDAAAQATSSTLTASSQVAAREPSLAETAARLAELFPALFMPGAFKPIKLRVQADIQQRAPGQFTKKQLSIFLHRHTTSTAYIRALVASTQRFDLDGQPAGEVAGEHLEAAKAELERRRQIVMQRRAVGRGPRAAMPRPAGPGEAVAADLGGEGSSPAAGAGGVADPAARQGPKPGPRSEGARGPRQDRRPQGDPAARGGRPAGRPRGPREGAPHAHAGRPMGDRQGERQGPRQDRPQRGPQDPHGRVQDRPRPRPPQDRAHGDQRLQPPAAQAEPPWPQDPERRERAQLLRTFEGSPLTAANFSALKGLALPQFETLIAQARRERDERGKGGAQGTGPARSSGSPGGAGAAAAPGTGGAASVGSAGSAAGAIGAPSSADDSGETSGS